MTNCHNCERLVICPWASPEEIICSSFKPKPITNYDLLIRKSPDELAEWLANNQDCYACPFFDDGEGICKGGDSCRGMMLDWLKQEVSK